MTAAQPELVRAIGRWSLVALVINCIIGSGIFGLPAVIAGQLGAWAPLGYVVAAAGIGIIMGCFAEVASRFTEAGGPYLYARAAFGSFVGIETGWLTWLARLAASAANANLFVDYLGGFLPAVTRGAPRMAVLSVIIGALSIINVRGVRSGTRTSNFFTAAKLVPLVVKKLLRSEEHTSELQSLRHLVCRLLLEKKKKRTLQLLEQWHVCDDVMH